MLPDPAGSPHPQRGTSPALPVRAFPRPSIFAFLLRRESRAKVCVRKEKGGLAPSLVHSQSPTSCDLAGRIPRTPEPHAGARTVKDNTPVMSRKGTRGRPRSVDAPELAPAEGVSRWT